MVEQVSKPDVLDDVAMFDNVAVDDNGDPVDYLATRGRHADYKGKEIRSHQKVCPIEKKN